MTKLEEIIQDEDILVVVITVLLGSRDWVGKAAKTKNDKNFCLLMRKSLDELAKNLLRGQRQRMATQQKEQNGSQVVN